MSKKLTRIELQRRLDRAAVARVRRLIRDHPEKFDYADFPPDRVKIPEQEARYEKRAKAHRKVVMEAMRSKWACIADSAEDTDLAASNGDDAQLEFPGLQ